MITPRFLVSWRIPDWLVFAKNWVYWLHRVLVLNINYICAQILSVNPILSIFGENNPIWYSSTYLKSLSDRVPLRDSEVPYQTQVCSHKIPFPRSGSHPIIDCECTALRIRVAWATLYMKWLQDMVIEVDKDSKGIIKFPNFLDMMKKKFSEENGEEEIRETFSVFDSVQYRFFSSSTLCTISLLRGISKSLQNYLLSWPW